MTDAASSLLGRSCIHIRPCVWVAPVQGGRILRYMAAIGMTRETGSIYFLPFFNARHLQSWGIVWVCAIIVTTVGRFTRSPQTYLSRRTVRSAETNTPSHKAFSIDLLNFQRPAAYPEEIRPMQESTTVPSANTMAWFTAFLFEDELGSLFSPHVLAHVGGGFVQHCAWCQPKSRHPSAECWQTLQQILPPLAAQLEGPALRKLGNASRCWNKAFC